MKKQAKGLRPAGEKSLRLSEDLLWGVHPVFEGLTNEPDRFTEIILQKDKRGSKIEEIIDLARRHGVKLNFVETVRLTGEESAQIRHQGIVARMSQAPLIALDTLIEKVRARIKAGENVRLMVGDSLQDPHNLGAIIRSALADAQRE